MHAIAEVRALLSIPLMARTSMIRQRDRYLRYTSPTIEELFGIFPYKREYGTVLFQGRYE